MDRESAERIAAAAARAPESPTARTGFADRAAEAADRNVSALADEDLDDWDA